VETKNYRRTLKEIIDGSSTCYLNNERRYIKHQSIADVVDFELVYDKHYDYAVSRGLPTEKEIFAQLEKDGVWSSEDDANIERQTHFVQSLQSNKKNIYLKSAISQINTQIKEAETELNKLVSQKNQLIENSCEKYAINRANDYYMISSFFKDIDLKDPLFTQEEFEYTEANDVRSMVQLYNEFHSKFTEENIQHLVLQDFYRIYYAFSESCVDFFGDPIVKLTNNQLNLIIYTRIFKSIFENHQDIPPTIARDPTALLDYANSSEAREDIKKKLGDENVGASSIVGATTEDLEELGMTPNASQSLHKAAEDKGGTLTMKDLMDISGV
jgi:hypothetical protein